MTPRITDFVLQRLPGVFSGGAEAVLLQRMLQALWPTTPKHRQAQWARFTQGCCRFCS
jgi:hypothetical protein